MNLHQLKSLIFIFISLASVRGFTAEQRGPQCQPVLTVRDVSPTGTEEISVLVDSVKTAAEYIYKHQKKVKPIDEKNLVLIVSDEPEKLQPFLRIEFMTADLLPKIPTHHQFDSPGPRVAVVGLSELKRFLAPKDQIAIDKERVTLLQSLAGSIYFVQNEEAPPNSMDLMLRSNTKVRSAVHLASIWITQKPISLKTVREYPELAHIQHMFETRNVSSGTSPAKGLSAERARQSRSNEGTPAFLQHLDEFVDLVRSTPLKSVRSRLTHDRSLYNWWFALTASDRYHLKVPWLLIFPKDVRDKLISVFDDRMTQKMINESEKLGTDHIPMTEALPDKSIIKRSLLNNPISAQYQPQAKKKHSNDPSIENDFDRFEQFFVEMNALVEVTPVNTLRDRIYLNPELKEWFYGLHSKQKPVLRVPWYSIFPPHVRSKLMVAFSPYVPAQDLINEQVKSSPAVPLEQALAQ
ncbi:MAG TPA: hypothetical protein PLU50_00055 [Pseudobdellovibrionaceae bacterium]|nr:hypothetical protein [Pseudobdellovibrionaceae bacterium]